VSQPDFPPVHCAPALPIIPRHRATPAYRVLTFTLSVSPAAANPPRTFGHGPTGAYICGGAADDADAPPPESGPGEAESSPTFLPFDEGSALLPPDEESPDANIGRSGDPRWALSAGVYWELQGSREAVF
jgi:hypothetical protein